jgi:hypothetical protein
MIRITGEKLNPDFVTEPTIALSRSGADVIGIIAILRLIA